MDGPNRSDSNSFLYIYILDIYLIWLDFSLFFSRLSRNWLTSSTFSLVRTKAMRITNTCSAQCKWKKTHFFVKRMWAQNHEAHNILGKVNGGLLSETLNLFRLSSKIEIKCLLRQCRILGLVFIENKNIQLQPNLQILILLNFQNKKTEGMWNWLCDRCN